MIKLIFLIACIGVTRSDEFNERPELPAPQYSPHSPQIIEIIRSEVENNGDGTYSYRYETSEGTIVEEKGYLKPPGPGTDEPIQVVEGSFQYYSPEGELIQLQYKADENGFQPIGKHLPVPPPIPEAIQKSLEIIYKNAAEQLKKSRRN